MYNEVDKPKASKPTPQIKIVDYTSEIKHRTIWEFTKIGETLKPVVENYTNRKSKWIGQIMLDENGGSHKPWECYILLSIGAPVHVLLHELIHASSASHFGNIAFANHRWEEELTVHFLSQELAVTMNIPIVDSGYDSGVEMIREFKVALGIEKSDLEFAAELIQQDLGDRWVWLAEQIYDKFGSNITTEQYLNFLNKVEEIKQWKP